MILSKGDLVVSSINEAQAIIAMQDSKYLVFT